LKNPNITKTSYKNQNYFRTTLPKSIKRIFKTIHGSRVFNTTKRKMGQIPQNNQKQLKKWTNPILGIINK